MILILPGHMNEVAHDLTYLKAGTIPFKSCLHKHRYVKYVSLSIIGKCPLFLWQMYGNSIWDVKPCSLETSTNLSEEPAAYIFYQNTWCYIVDHQVNSITRGHQKTPLGISTFPKVGNNYYREILFQTYLLFTVWVICAKYY